MKNLFFNHRVVTFLLLLLPLNASLATTVQQFNLSQMTENAEKIFRGEVVSIEAGTISVGGGELAITTYTLQVNELLKGELTQRSNKVSRLVELKMVGSPKAATAKNGVRFVGGFRTPNLIKGNEYLLFTTPPSSIGLSMTVGVGQGLFSFKDGSLVRNEFDNAGLFRGMASATDFASQGPIKYDELVEQIESLVQE